MHYQRFIGLIIVAFWTTFGGFCPVEAKGPNPQPMASEPLQIESVKFYYKLDEGIHLLKHRQIWEKAHKEELTMEALQDIAFDAFTDGKVEDELLQWKEQGGPHPWIFQPKIHVVNGTNRALLNASVVVTLQGYLGELLADGELYLTDYSNLLATAQWKVLSQDTVTIDVIAPGEDLFVDLTPIQVLGIVSQYTGQWPVNLTVQAQLRPMAGVSVDTTLKSGSVELIPDHFVTPYATKLRIIQ